jgi:hypothetical protein
LSVFLLLSIVLSVFLLSIVLSVCLLLSIVFQQYFSYIMVTSFSGGRSRSTRREPPTMGKQLVNFITCSCEWSAQFFYVPATKWPGHISVTHVRHSVIPK